MAKGYGRMGGGHMGGMGSMRNQFQDLQRQMAEQQEKIAATEVTSSVGGGEARVQEWVAISFSRGSSPPRD